MGSDRFLQTGEPIGRGGFCGLRLFELAIEAGDSETGCTVHLVTAEIDAGRTLAQATVPVLPDDTAETLHQRIKTEEHKLLPKVLNEWREFGLPVRGAGAP